MTELVLISANVSYLNNMKNKNIKKKGEKWNIPESLRKATKYELDNCICAEWGEGRSTCGFPCSIHNPTPDIIKKAIKFDYEKLRKIIAVFIGKSVSNLYSVHFNELKYVRWDKKDLGPFINFYNSAYREGQKDILERVKIETDACVCECGEKWIDQFTKNIKEILK